MGIYSTKENEFEDRISSIEKQILSLKNQTNNISSFDRYKWSGNLENLDPRKIYAYYEPDGGIYKIMGLSLIGNEDFDKLSFNREYYYYGFVRIDNICGYCQFMYKSLQKLFNNHNKSLHKDFQMYEFDNTKIFLEWCLSFDKIY